MIIEIILSMVWIYQKKYGGREEKKTIGGRPPIFWGEWNIKLICFLTYLNGNLWNEIVKVGGENQANEKG